MQSKNKNIFVLATLFSLLALNLVYGAGIDQMASNVTNEIRTTAAAIFRILNTVIATIGVAYIVVTGMVYIFKPEQVKEHSKVLIVALVAIGALYGATAMGTNFFG